MRTEIIGIIAGIFTGVSLLPQLVKTIKEKTAQHISLLMLISLLVGISLWVVYGIRQKDWPITITNSFSLAVNCCLLLLNTYYSRQRKN